MKWEDEPEVGQWRINSAHHRRYQSAFLILAPSGNLQWLCRYETGQNVTYGREYVRGSTNLLVVCICSKRPIASGDYMCWGCRIRVNAGG